MEEWEDEERVRKKHKPFIFIVYFIFFGKGLNLIKEKLIL